MNHAEFAIRRQINLERKTARYYKYRTALIYIRRYIMHLANILYHLRDSHAIGTYFRWLLFLYSFLHILKKEMIFLDYQYGALYIRVSTTMQE